MQFRLTDLAQIDAWAQALVRQFGDYKIWLFEGEMGAGKTTLIKAVCKAFGVIDPTSSPTFALVNVYEDAQKQTYYHFDFYRIKDESEALDIGADEYFHSGHHCFIEWHDKVKSLLPPKRLTLSIHTHEANHRTIEVSRIH